MRKPSTGERKRARERRSELRLDARTECAEELLQRWFHGCLPLHMSLHGVPGLSFSASMHLNSKS